MATADYWTLSQLRAAVRQDLMDPSARWWSDVELNSYIEDWQNFLQERYEFVFNTATITTALTTLTLTAVATDILRLDAIYWNNFRLVARDKEELEIIQRYWRQAFAVPNPEAVYQDDIATVSIWPPPEQAGTVVFEYPKLLTFAGTDGTPMSIPPWTKYSVKNYCAYRALLRTGPNQDLQRAARRKAKFERQVVRYRVIWDQYLPDKAPKLLPKNTRYEADILTVGKNNNLFQTWY